MKSTDAEKYIIHCFFLDGEMSGMLMYSFLLLSSPLLFLRNSLRYNGIGPAGAASLADALKQNSTATLIR